MKILFTGGSSFTGCWFIRELARAGHEVVAIFRRSPDAYPDELRRTRVEIALEHSHGVFDCSFGDDTFMDLLRSQSWDVLCHHAAVVTDYKSEDFDVGAALAENTHNVAAVTDALATGERAASLVVTGSVFENDEGAGAEYLPAFSPYGLSKSLTWQVLRYHAGRACLGLGKFVIPNPFGPLEEPRFTAYLMKNWYAGNIPAVNTPTYVRDNIHVSLLAPTYREFVERVVAESGIKKLSPSGYVETQGAFAKRFAAAMRSRLGLACELDLLEQTDFSEPLERYNTDIVDTAKLGWNEAAAWDEIAEFYAARLDQNQ